MGGTGRFAGAAGTGSFTVTVNTDGSQTAVWDGEIRLQQDD